MLQPKQTSSLRAGSAGDFRAVALEPDPSPSCQWASQAQSHSDTSGQHAGPGHCDLSCSTRREVVTLPSPWSVICTGQWPGQGGPSLGGWEIENILASSIMSAKRAEQKKTNLVKDKRSCTIWGLPHRMEVQGWVGRGIENTPMDPWLFLF